MTDLTATTTPDLDGSIAIPAGWRQGRGAFGGLTIAACIRAIEQRVADPRRVVRSVTAEIPAPTLAGDAEIEVAILRAGNAVTVARAVMRQAGEVTTHAVAVLGSDRATAEPPPTWCELAPPIAPPWRDVAPIEMSAAAEFAAHFEYRVASGLPLAGGAAVTIGYVRARDPGLARDAAYIAALADAYWPAALVRATTPRPMATIAFTLDIVGALPADDAPVLYRGTVAVAGHGYFQETRELWTTDGRLVALNHQTMVVIA